MSTVSYVSLKFYFKQVLNKGKLELKRNGGDECMKRKESWVKYKI